MGAGFLCKRKRVEPVRCILIGRISDYVCPENKTHGNAVDELTGLGTLRRLEDALTQSPKTSKGPTDKLITSTPSRLILELSLSFFRQIRSNQLFLVGMRGTRLCVPPW